MSEIRRASLIARSAVVTRAAAGVSSPDGGCIGEAATMGDERPFHPLHALRRHL